MENPILHSLEYEYEAATVWRVFRIFAIIETLTMLQSIEVDHFSERLMSILWYVVDDEDSDAYVFSDYDDKKGIVIEYVDGQVHFIPIHLDENENYTAYAPTLKIDVKDERWYSELEGFRPQSCWLYAHQMLKENGWL